MATQQTRLVKDLYTNIPSSIKDQAGLTSSITNNFYRRIDRPVSGSLATYIEFDTYGLTYECRLEPYQTIPTSIQIKCKYALWDWTGTYNNVVVALGGGIRLDFFLNEELIGTMTSTSLATMFTDETQDVTYTLSGKQLHALLSTRNKESYNTLKIKVGITVDDTQFQSLSISGKAKIFALEVYYKNNNSETYNNSGSFAGYVGRHYPQAVSGASGYYIYSSGASSGFNMSNAKDYLLGTASGTGPDGTFIQKRGDEPGWFPLKLTFSPFSGLSNFNKINKGTLYLRYYNPTASGTNATDAFEVYGTNPNFPSNPIMYGAGQYLSGSLGFYTVSTELSWIKNENYVDEESYLNFVYSGSGNAASEYYKSTESLKDVELSIYGIPSGGRISAAEFIINSADGSYLPLHLISSVTSGVGQASGSYTDSGKNLFRGEFSKELFNRGFYSLSEQTGSIVYPHINSGLYSGVIMYCSGASVGPGLEFNYRAVTPTYWKPNSHIDFLYDSGVSNYSYKYAMLLDNQTLNARTSKVIVNYVFPMSHEKTIYLHYSYSGDRANLINGAQLLNHSAGTTSCQIETNGDKVKTSQYKGPGDAAVLEANIYDPNIQVLYVCRKNGSLYDFLLYTSIGDSLQLRASSIGVDIQSNSNPDDVLPPVGANQRDRVVIGGQAGAFGVVNPFYGFIHEYGVSSSGWTDNDIRLFSESRHNLKDYIGISGSDATLSLKIKNVSGYYNTPTFPIYFDSGMGGILDIDPSVYAYNTILGNPSSVYLDMNYNKLSGTGFISGEYNILGDGNVIYRSDLFARLSNGSGQNIKIYPSGVSGYAGAEYSRNDYSSVNHLLSMKYVDSTSGVRDIDFSIINAKMGLNGWAAIPSESSGINLYTNNAYNDSGNIHLFINNKFEASGIDFYVKNFYESGNLSLFTKAHELVISGIDLTILNFVKDSGNINLVTSGNYINYETLNLYIENTVYSISGSLHLGLNNAGGDIYALDGVIYYLDSSGNRIIDSSGNYLTSSAAGSYINTNSLNLSLYSDPELEHQLNLFTKSDSDTNTAYMNLFMSADPLQSGWVDLFVRNDSSGNNRNLKLYTYGSNIPESGALNLYIGRSAESVYNTLDLTVGSDKYNTDTVDMYMYASIKETGNINMYTSGKDPQNKSINLKIGGF